MSRARQSKLLLSTCAFLPLLLQLVLVWHFHMYRDIATGHEDTRSKLKDIGPAIHFRTYGNKKYEASKQRLLQEAEESGWFQSALALGPEDLPQNFQNTYAEVLAQPRGGGYWIWKYPVLEMALSTIRDKDFLVYLDAGCALNKNGEKRFREYIEMLQRSKFDVIGFELRNHLEYLYTTERLFQALHIDANDTIRNSGQIMATVLVMQKGPHLRKWLDMVNGILEKDAWLFTDKYNEETKKLNPKFEDARHDQSVLSLTRKLVGFLKFPDDTYPPGRLEMPFWAARRNL